MILMMKKIRFNNQMNQNQKLPVKHLILEITAAKNQFIFFFNEIKVPNTK